MLTVGPNAVEWARGHVTPSTILHAGTASHQPRAATAFPQPRGFGAIVTLLPFLVVGLVPSFSLFFVGALEAYTIYLVRLIPIPS